MPYTQFKFYNSNENGTGIIMQVQQSTFREVAILAHCFQITLKFRVLAFVEGGKPEDLEKNSMGKDEEQQQT